MTYLQVRAGGHRMLVAVDEVARTGEACPADGVIVNLSSAPRAFVVCLDGRVLGVDEVRPIIEVPNSALLPVPWLPTAPAALFDAFVETASAWRLRRGARLPS